MFIRDPARELYRLERELDRLKKKPEPVEAGERDALDLELRRVTAERNRLRAILESKKEKPPSRRTFH